MRCNVTNIRETNRGSKGVKLIGLSDKDSLVGVSEVVMLDEGNDPDSIDIEQEGETVALDQE